MVEAYSIVKIIYNLGLPSQSPFLHGIWIRNSSKRDHSIWWMIVVTTCNSIKSNFVNPINYVYWHTPNEGSSFTHTNAPYGKWAMGYMTGHPRGLNTTTRALLNSQDQCDTTVNINHGNTLKTMQLSTLKTTIYLLLYQYFFLLKSS